MTLNELCKGIRISPTVGRAVSNDLRHGPRPKAVKLEASPINAYRIRIETKLRAATSFAEFKRLEIAWRGLHPSIRALTLRTLNEVRASLAFSLAPPPVLPASDFLDCLRKAA